MYQYVVTNYISVETDPGIFGVIQVQVYHDEHEDVLWTLNPNVPHRQHVAF